MNPFPDKIVIRDGGLNGSSRWFILLKRFRQISSYGIIYVPAGFHTDGASIPKIFWPIIGPFGPYFAAAIIHDFLYSKLAAGTHPSITRRDADDIFLEGMELIGVPFRHRWPMYFAVRTFGWRSYQKR